MRFKKILITGSDGFIGSHLVEYCIKMGIKVRAFVFYNSFNSYGWLDHIDAKTKNKIDFFSGDIRNFDVVYQAAQGCDAILHLAALVGIPYSYISPENYIDTNIVGTLNVLKVSRMQNIKKIILTSTSEVYGTAKYIPIDESHPLNAQSPYASTKIGADSLGLSFHKSFNMPVSILRPFNTYGPRQSARAVIPTIISQLLNNNSYVKLGNINPTRDLNYVQDVVRAFYLCLIKKESIGRIINIGSNYEISIKELAHLIAKILNKKIVLHKDKIRQRPKNSEVERLYSSNKLAKKILGWKPGYGGKKGLEKGLIETIDWFKKNNHYLYKSNNYNI